jgi:parallel beta-helix repeat protein
MNHRSPTRRSWQTLLFLFFFIFLSGAPVYAATFYVSDATGNDTRSPAAAQNEATPWKTIKHALNTIGSGDTVIVRPGVYNEGGLETNDDSITLRAVPRHQATIVGAAGNEVVFIENAGVVVESFLITGGTIGVRVHGHSGVVRDNVVYGNTQDGILFNAADDGIAEDNIVHTNGGMGIRYFNGDRGVIRNNLVYKNGSDWGISLEPTSTNLANRIEGNTVDRNVNGIRITAPGSGIPAAGTILSNIITNNTGIGLKSTSAAIVDDYNNVFSNTPNFEFSDPAHHVPGVNTTTVDPRYVDPDGADNQLGGNNWQDDKYHLSQKVAGQSQDSPCVDTGSPLVMETGTTSTANFPDEGAPDKGFHYSLVTSAIQPFSLAEVKTSFTKKPNGIAGSYDLDGQLRLGAGSDGIDPAAERVKVELDTFTQIFPVGSCKKQIGTRWMCTASAPGVIQLRIDLGAGTFVLKAKNVPNPPAPLAPNVRVRLSIGGDLGMAEMLYTHGTLFAP